MKWMDQLPPGKAIELLESRWTLGWGLSMWDHQCHSTSWKNEPQCHWDLILWATMVKVMMPCAQQVGPAGRVLNAPDPTATLC